MAYAIKRDALQPIDSVIRSLAGGGSFNMLCDLADAHQMGLGRSQLAVVDALVRNLEVCYWKFFCGLVPTGGPSRNDLKRLAFTRLEERGI